jgi:DNA-binding HxlR family transcriptional regulator
MDNFMSVPIIEVLEGFINKISDTETIEIINDLGGFDLVISEIKKEIEKINPHNEKQIDLRLMLLKRIFELKK